METVADQIKTLENKHFFLCCRQWTFQIGCLGRLQRWTVQQIQNNSKWTLGLHLLVMLFPIPTQWLQIYVLERYMPLSSYWCKDSPESAVTSETPPVHNNSYYKLSLKLSISFKYFSQEPKLCIYGTGRPKSEKTTKLQKKNRPWLFSPYHRKWTTSCPMPKRGQVGAGFVLTNQT